MWEGDAISGILRVFRQRPVALHVERAHHFVIDPVSILDHLMETVNALLGKIESFEERIGSLRGYL